MLHRLTNFFDSHRRCCYALGVVIAVGAAVALGNYYRLQVEDVYQASIEMQTQEYAADLQQWKSDGFAIGALSILGRHNPSLKRVILEREPSAELMEQAAIPLKTLSMVVGANHAFVLNRDGVVVAAHDHQGQAPLGLNVAFRPYFKVALNGGRILDTKIAWSYPQSMRANAADLGRLWAEAIGVQVHTDLARAA